MNGSEETKLEVELRKLLSELKTADSPLEPKLRSLLLQCVRGSAGANETTLSSRAKHMATRKDPGFDLFYEMQKNQYSAENTTGNINFCCAENNICTDLIAERFRKDPGVFTPNFEHLTHYGAPGGHLKVKQFLSQYFKDEYNADVNHENLALLPSGNASYDLICHCALDSQDVILTTGPTYARNFISVSERAECVMKTVPCNLDDPKLCVADFEKSFQEFTAQGNNVRAVILINPHNPLGVVFPEEDIKKLAEWTAKRNLWLIIDEIFAQCIYDDTPFSSFVSYQISLPTKSVWFWSLTKDYGMPGIKLSIAHTNDRDMAKALNGMEPTEPVSTLAQDFAVNLLSDRAWLEGFKAEKKKRLRAQYEFVAANLRQLSIPFVKASAGVFVWIDLRKKLSSQSVAGEDELWKALIAKGVYMTPGTITECSEPGWFRLVFACDKEQCREGIRRFNEFFGSKQTVGDISY